MASNSGPVASRLRKILLVALTVVLVVVGAAAPGEAWSRDHRGGHRPPAAHRVDDDRFVHRRDPGRDHDAVRDRHDWRGRVIVRHRYPPIGHRLWWAPRWEAAFVIGGLSYYYLEGAFYRPWGTGFISVAAPIGAYLAFLPPDCSVVYVGGARYYYGNGAYYAWDAARAGYVVVAPPATAEEPPAEGGAPAVFIYPKAGQSAALQEQDRQECEEWATSQTGFDPRHETGDAAKRADYRRAMGACLEGREYTVK
jgi:hypothetical protein